MTSFLLPCGCGVDIPVTSSQAGGLATCPSCGRQETVPRLRDLGKLRVATDEAPARSSAGWTGWHGLLLAGSLLAAAAGMLSVSFTPPEVDLFDDATIKSSVMKTPIDEVYEVYLARLSHTSIDRPPTDLEARSQARADYYHSLRNGLRTAAALGALAAVVGGSGLIFSARKVQAR